ncbi:hypothetical protein CHL79_09450 [Delftia acidovorans]|nr:hypothetical protein CHL79_09450 [Delftia acidovorans]
MHRALVGHPGAGSIGARLNAQPDHILRLAWQRRVLRAAADVRKHGWSPQLLVDCLRRWRAPSAIPVKDECLCPK